jgi:hypothetical protein
MMKKLCDCPHCNRAVDITGHNMIDMIPCNICCEFFEPEEARNVRDHMNFYRYDEIIYDAPYREIKLTMTIFSLVKETKKGYWIKESLFGMSHGKRWVSKTSVKRYAYPTKEEALQSFIKRKERQIRILTSRLNVAQDALKEAKKEKEKTLGVLERKDAI